MSQHRSSFGGQFQKGFKYRLYPNQAQQRYLAQVFGACRYVYNRQLAENQTAYQLWKSDKTRYPTPSVNAFGFMLKLPQWKQDSETSWLADIPSQSLQQACAHAADAFKQFFRRGHGYPKFRTRKGRQAAHYTNQNSSIRDGKLWLGKCPGTIKIVVDERGLPAHFTQCVVSRSPSGKYYVSFRAHYTPEKTSGDRFIGMDLGLTDLATLSTGEVLPNPRYYLQAQRKLGKLQRQLAKKQKGSKNRNKARQRLAKVYERVSNLRGNTLHTFTTSLIREHQAIGIEDLNVKGMMQNRRLSKHIGDASWGEIGRQLRYKAVASQHCTLVIADPFYPSTQLCSCCGKKPVQRLKLYERRWTCLYCGSTHQRDINAAENLKQLAIREHIRKSDPNTRIILTRR